MNIFLKMIISIVILVVILTSIFYIESSKNSGRVTDINVFIEVDNESVRIKNIEGNLEAVSKVGVPTGGGLEAPGVTVLILQEMRPVSDWYSLTLMNSSRVYNFKIGLYDSFSDDKPVSIYVQAIDRNSKELISVQKRLLLNKSSR